MNRLLLILSITLIFNASYAQQYIKINDAADPESTYSPKELIEEVLISGGCAEISNVTKQVEGEPNDRQKKSYGFFKRGNVNFPFEEGIIMSTGYAYSHIENGGKNSDFLSIDSDADIDNYLNLENTNDATFFKFNFTPFTDKISFRFLMSSKEYSLETFTCGKTDGFAFLLRKAGTNNYQNLAILPNGDRVSVNRINTTDKCGQNQEFFTDQNIGTIDFGRTIPITAQADVTPGQEYEIKLVVTDQGDSQYNSAIFIEAGSFNLGGGLGDDITIAAGNAVCYGKEVKLSTGFDASTTHEWFKDGTKIPGESGSTLVVTEPGEYSVKVEYSEECKTEDSVIIEFIPSGVVKDLKDLSACDKGDGNIEFDLTVNTPLALGDQDPNKFTVKYFESQADADAGTPEIADPTKYNGKNGQKIYVRVQAIGGDECFGTDSFTLTVGEANAKFTMESNCEKGATVKDAPATTGGSYSFEVAPTDGAVIDATTGEITNGTFGTTYKVKYTITGDCPGEHTVDITIFDELTLTTPTPLEACDNDPIDGFTDFDLESKSSEIKGTKAYTITYHKTEDDAKNATAALTSPYTNEVVNEQTVYVLAVDENTGCKKTTTLLLKVTKSPNVAFEMEPSCVGAIISKSPATGGGSYAFDPQPTDGATIDATTGEITNATSGATYKVKYTVTGDCPAESTVDVTILDGLDITAPTPLEVCDDKPFNGIAEFDLKSKDDEITGGNASYTVSYHKTKADADADTAPLDSPYLNETPNEQVIYALVKNTASGCTEVVNLTLKVTPAPDVSFDMETACTNAKISKAPGTTGGVYTFEPTVTDNAKIDANTGAITDATAGATYTIMYAISGACPAEAFLEITMQEGLEVNAPEPLENCDNDDKQDGYTAFDLTEKDGEIKGANANYIVSYHKTESDAKSGKNSLPIPYTNEDADEQIIYAQVTNPETGCIGVTPLKLIVAKKADASFEMEPTCGGAIVTSTTTEGGTFSFDPTPTDGAIIDATTGEITLGTSNTNYTVLYTIKGECGGTFKQDVTVKPTPEVIKPDDLLTCDEQNDTDSISTFDLTSVIDQVTGGNTNLTVTFFETQQQAEDGTDPIANPTQYENKPSGGNNAQTIFIRVTSDLECASFTTLTIRVVPNPSPGTPITLEECDDNDDERAVFDLTENETYIVNGENDVALTYYRTSEDAELKQNGITDPKQFPNESNPQTIFVRVENTGDSEEAKLGCYAITSFDIKVNPIPDFNVTIEDYIACDDDADDRFPFDLDSKVDEILNNVDAKSEYKVTFHETQEDADTGEDALAPLYYNEKNPQTIYVRIESTLTECANATNNFKLIVDNNPVANSDLDPLILIQCDETNSNDGNPANDSATFDISSLTPEVLDNLDPNEYAVSYYTSLADAEAPTNEITNTTSFKNTTNPQIIYVRVDNIKNSTTSYCYGSATMTLKVNPLPPVDIDDRYLICKDVNGSEVNDEVEIDTGLSKQDYKFEWTMDGTNTVFSTESSIIPTEPGVYTVKVTNKNTGCEATDITTVVVSTPPKLGVNIEGVDFSENQGISVTANSGGEANDYEFSLDDGPWETNGTNIYLFANVAPGPHTVKVRDINGCGMSETTVFVLGYPHFFSPNNDGYNDKWQIYGIENFPNTTIHIFDRYGKLLKQISPMGEGWDGTINGRALPSSDYWFVVEYVDPRTDERKVFKSHFSLKR